MTQSYKHAWEHFNRSAALTHASETRGNLVTGFHCEAFLDKERNHVRDTASTIRVVTHLFAAPPHAHAMVDSRLTHFLFDDVHDPGVRHRLRGIKTLLKLRHVSFFFFQVRVSPRRKQQRDQANEGVQCKVEGG